MPKANKSSASSGTRKKHAKKSTKDDEADGPTQQQPAQRGQKKLTKAQKKLPKVKQYIPPPKPPAPPIPDPLDGQGLARTLPAELVVVLRRLGKKDEVTRRKGLEELREWVSGLKEGDEVEQELRETALLSAVPVWLHNLASLLQSPFHRTLALQLQSELLNLPSTRTAIIDTLSLGLLPGTQNRDVLGSWFVAALEDGRRSGVTKGWEDSTSWEAAEGQINLTENLGSLVEYLSLAILDPATLHEDIHPAPVSSAPTPVKSGKTKFVMPTQTAEPTEEEDTSEHERLSPYRIGGLVGLSKIVQVNSKQGAKPSPELLSLLRHPLLWSALSSEPVEDSANIGVDQPGIRKSAYALLDTFIEAYPDIVGETETKTLLAGAVHSSCWFEKDASVWQQAGQAVVKFLTKYRDSWTIASKSQNTTEDDEDEDDEDSDDDEETFSKPFSDFLGWVSTICPLIPHLTYPLLLVIISTIPDDILPLDSSPSDPLQSFFTHLWSPIDARLLSTHSMPSQQSAFQAFFQGTLDCTVFLIGKAARKEDGMASAEWLVREPFAGRAWTEGVLDMGARAGKRRGQESTVEFEADIFGKALARVAASGSSLADLALPFLRNSLISRSFQTEDGKLTKSANALLSRSLGIITAVRGGIENPTLDSGLGEIIGEISRRATTEFSNVESPDISAFADVLLTSLQSHQDDIPEDTKQVLVKTLSNDLQALSSTLSPQTIIKLFEALSVQQSALNSTLWSVIDSPNTPRETRFALSAILAGSESALVDEGNLDQITLEATQSALEAESASGVQVARSALLRKILALVCTSIHDQVDDIINGAEDAMVPESAMEIFAAYAEVHPEELAQSDVLLQALVAVHHLVFLLPRNSLETFAAPPSALSIWKAVDRISTDGQDVVAYKVAHALKDMLGQTSCLIEPAVLVDVSLSSQIGDNQKSASEVQDALLPSASDLQAMISAHAALPAHPTLAIMDPLVVGAEVETSSQSYDPQGRSKAARYADAALAILRTDRQLVQSNSHLLIAILSAAIFAKDTLAVPSGGRTSFSPDTERSLLSDLIREAEGTLSFALANIDDAAVAWHQSAVSALATKTPTDPQDFVQELLLAVKNDILQTDSDIAARVLRDVLGRHFRQSGAGEKEVEIWLAYAMTMMEKSTSLFIAIFLAIKPLLLDSERFQTAQNRLASYLTTIKPSQAGKEGIPAIRRLLTSAPPADAPSVFLPQQRAIFVLRHIGSWLTSDEADDFDESMEVYVTQLYAALAPVVQDVSGGHWDAIFDMIESGLDASMDDESAHCLLYQCLLLLQQVRDLASSNKALKALWVGKDQQLGLVLKLFLQCRQADTVPTQLIHTAILDLLQDVPDKAVEAADVQQLSDLIRLSSSTAIQSTAYGVLSRVIKTRTISLVVEAEAASTEEEGAGIEISLPAGLVEIVSAAADWSSELPLSTALSHLLGWMAILDHFEDASRTLRWAYLDQITSSKLLGDSLIPMLFAILGVTEVGAWNFPSGQFGIDEFYTDQLADLAPLASHIFYRSLITLPSAMRTYYESLKDRQLSMSMLNFTARHYSPVIIKQEFSALRQPAAMALLTEEGLSVRIAQGGGATVVAGTGSAEAVASYVVDEQPMEIGIRLPAEFPLRGVEIRDLKRVGVPENKWRGWLMSVQQTITSRNGLILEALTVFKKNVSLHFEGVVECAICYSIISLTDRTLPTKPCRTCKNRFHASCLFKWFNSSHSSSCPMCRALF